MNNIGQVLLFDTNGDGLITPQDTVVADTVAAGYITPLDADSTDIFDFKEEDDFTIVFNTHPSEDNVKARNNKNKNLTIRFLLNLQIYKI